MKPHAKLFKVVSDALAAQQTPRFDDIIRKSQAICFAALVAMLASGWITEVMK